MFALTNGVCCCFGATAELTKSAFSKSIKLSYIGVSLFFSLFLIFSVFFGDVLIKAFANLIGCPNNEELAMCLGISLIV